MNIFVISLGGSVMIPDQIDYQFLNRFVSEIRSLYPKSRFVIVTGGGSIARKYIEVLRKEGKNLRELSNAGIRITRMNALFLMQLFGKEANDKLPRDMIEVKNNLHKNNVVICGSLRYDDDETSDGTAAKLARFLKCPFINITNVAGLYTADPKKTKNTKFISKISWADFESIANKIKFKAGQHFVLDQQAARVIRKYRIKTFIIDSKKGKIKNIVQGKKLVGTVING